jgi:hypothetical protein
MIRPNNPAVNVDELMVKVRAQAEQLRKGTVIDDARDRRRSSSGGRLLSSLDRHEAINSLLDIAEQRNRPRTQVPQRLARMRGLGERPTRFMLRVFNYFFRQQREVDAAQTHAMREMMTILYVVGRHLSNLTDRVADLEERLENDRREP